MRRVLVVLSQITLAACGAGRIGSDKDGGDCQGAACGDAGVRPDAFLRCGDFGGPPCKSNEVCFQNQCIPNACQGNFLPRDGGADAAVRDAGPDAAPRDGGAASGPCAPGELCNMACVALTDPCQGVECGEDMTCVSGNCVPGCYGPSPCLNKVCPAGEYC